MQRVGTEQDLQRWREPPRFNRWLISTDPGMGFRILVGTHPPNRGCLKISTDATDGQNPANQLIW